MYDCRSGIINPDCTNAVCVCDDQPGYEKFVRDLIAGRADDERAIMASLARQNQFYRDWEAKKEARNRPIYSCGRIDGN